MGHSMRTASELDLLLVRSGRTAWEELGRVQGATDLPLSERGRAAAIALTNHLAGSGRLAGVEIVASAPDEASVETARLIAERVGKRARVVEELRALSLGLWEGRLEEDLLSNQSSVYRGWRSDPAMVRPPEGESFADGAVRVLGRLARLGDRASGRGMAVVLRPMEFGLARLAAAGLPTGDLWSMVESGPMTERVGVPRTRLASGRRPATAVA
jgi:broad specificity phosphatase PhoE